MAGKKGTDRRDFKTRCQAMWRDMVKYRWLYFLLIPGILFFAIFKYVPMFGLRIAFMDYNQYNPAKSTWVWFDQFEKLFSGQSFYPVLRNTVVISLLKLIIGFPIPVVLALMMNEMRSMKFKKISQTLLYLPHFISWNYIHRRFGVEGEHYVDNGDGTYEITVTPEENDSQNIGLKLFQDLFSRKDFCNIENSAETTELFNKVAANSRDAYSHSIEKRNPEAYVVNMDKGTDIGDAVKVYIWGVIGGSKSLNDWDAYVQQVKDLGVQDIIDELAQIHGDQVKQYEEYMKNAQ